MGSRRSLVWVAFCLFLAIPPAAIAKTGATIVGFTTALALGHQHGATNVTATPDAIVSIDVATGAAKVLAPFPNSIEVYERAYDPAARVLYALVGASLMPFEVDTATFGPPVALDTGGCDGGALCQSRCCKTL